jgi:hypothetical protein
VENIDCTVIAERPKHSGLSAADAERYLAAALGSEPEQVNVKGDDGGGAGASPEWASAPTASRCFVGSPDRPPKRNCRGFHWNAAEGAAQ